VLLIFVNGELFWRLHFASSVVIVAWRILWWHCDLWWWHWVVWPLASLYVWDYVPGSNATEFWNGCIVMLALCV